MRRIQILTLALLVCLVAVAPRASVSARKQRLDPRASAPGEVIVKLKQNARALSPPERAERLTRVRSLASENNRPMSDLPVESLVSGIANDRVSKIISGRGLDRVFVLKFDPNADLDSIIDELRSRDDVEYAEPNYRIKLGTVTANDPGFSSQWSLMNLGVGIDIVVDSTGRVERFPATLNADIKANAAWEITTGSPNVIVAVSDSGVDVTHPDLERNIYTNPAEIPDNGIDDDKNGFVDDVHGYNVADKSPDVSDVVGHGTQMAGLIAAEINNNIGIAGVSQSKILPVRFYKKTGPDPEDFETSVADAARSLIYSIAAGASIINASWRSKLDSEQVPAEFAQALEDAVSATNDAGILLVCIAGNEGYNNDVSKIYPAAYQMPNQIVVAASDYNDEIWHPLFNPFHHNSGFGAHTVDLAAPGVAVLSTAARGDCVLCSRSQKPEDWYARGDGTSVSAALVSGVAALVKSMHPNDNAILLKRRILAGVDVLDSLNDVMTGERLVITGGRLNAAGALTASITISQPVLVSMKYKGGGEKLFVWVTDTEKGFKVVVGNTAYSAKQKGERFLARVPKSAFPSGVGVDIKLRNPDGGESQPITFTR